MRGLAVTCDDTPVIWTLTPANIDFIARWLDLICDSDGVALGVVAAALAPISEQIPIASAGSGRVA